MAAKQKVEEKKPLGVVYDFTQVPLTSIKGESEKHDLSRIVANVYWNSTPDIGQMDKAKEIFYHGKTELTADECRLFEQAIMFSELPGVIKLAIQGMFNKEREVVNG